MRATRNEYGEIELPERPEDGIPTALLGELERWVFTPDVLIGIAKCEILESLMMSWFTLLDRPVREAWLAAATEVIADQSDQSGDASTEETLPSGEVEFLLDELIALPPDDRALVLESIRALTSNWFAVMTNHERLLGHLLLGHNQPSSVMGHPEDNLCELHAQLHLTSSGRSFRPS